MGKFVFYKIQIMEQLFQHFNIIKKDTDLHIKRYLHEEIDWSNRLIAITGARGSGKTTLLLQYIKSSLPNDETVLYASLDHLYFTENSLLDLADSFVQQGGTHLFLDEVHKYPDWSIAIKNIYDTYKKLKVVFTGSSILEIHRSKGDLSRRAVEYKLQGLSFREFMAFESGIHLPKLSLQDICKKHLQLATELTSLFKPLPAFKKYLQYGYYPYFVENRKGYGQKLRETINLTIEVDLPSVQHMDFTSVHKLKKLLYVLSQTVPFKPNVSKLADRIETTRPSLLLYLQYLEQAQLIMQLHTQGKGLSSLTKAEKIYPGNPNMMHVLASGQPDKGTMRETFFMNHLKGLHQVNATATGDFLIDETYTFEVGGKTKDYSQIKQVKNSFLALDEIETGVKQKIPLWLFGLLY